MLLSTLRLSQMGLGGKIAVRRLPAAAGIASLGTNAMETETQDVSVRGLPFQSIKQAMKAILRRTNASKPAPTRILGHWTLHANKKEVTVDDHSI
jgi:hypothetical protein